MSARDNTIPSALLKEGLETSSWNVETARGFFKSSHTFPNPTMNNQQVEPLERVPARVSEEATNTDGADTLTQ